ncbi:hypothetical protein BP5796_09259 [Coleophoma crateriformis]|uniref:AAA+ ATPase domain-containing protein n=1 Tax=Coleophoma crateriformis TaxID=565419 RepID=A0A3D8R3H9_9HELO|nr:hypothetical protein BP5796_09259 [Coleophoma crateriformis]
MPSIPSVSRNKANGFGFYYEDPTKCSSILGKRGWGSGDDTVAQPDAKKRTTQNLPSSSALAEGLGDENSTWSGSDGDEGEQVELDTTTKLAKESFLPTSIPDPKQELSCNDSDALLKRKHVFASRKIFRRHSIATPYTKDVSKVDTGGNYHEYNVLGTKCDSLLRRCGFPTVYRISCSAKDSKYHATFLYEDDPVQAVFTSQRQTSHLSGNKPIYQFRDYVNRFEQSSWVIVKNRTCNNQIAQSHQHKRYNENMIILSEELRQAINKVATCPLDVPGGKTVGKDELLEMEAPYLFLYNHREPLRVHSQSATASLRNMIDSVLEYLDRNYAQEYDEAEQLISKEKEWVDLPVSRVKPVKWNKQPFEDLVLDEDTKQLVKALVMIRASSIKKKGDDTDFDVISGKGNGLIMLFHGSPGTGKTLTAESVAEIAEMPLYPITCGDIGTEPEKVEQYLQLVFQLGKRWNCVLLLDEADVFLEERTLTDLQRNSLVSIFLRMLEYYEGILILTSNRVGTFDEAFRSRIHIALHYDDLKPRSRKQIWSNFLARLEGTDEGENVDQIKDRLDELAKHDLNGREIRNALSTARQLASHAGEKMRWKHLELAIKTTNNFGNYLRDVHGHSDREWVKEAGTR